MPQSADPPSISFIPFGFFDIIKHSISTLIGLNGHMQKLVLLLLLVALGLGSCSARKCNGQKGIKTPMGRM